MDDRGAVMNEKAVRYDGREAKNLEDLLNGRQQTVHTVAMYHP